MASQRQSLYAEYAKLKDEVRDAEVIRRCVETVLREEPQQQRSRVQETEI